MSYLDSASLLMIPSGYKEDKVFSQLPEDGSGDLTFTRASDGTRVNSEGYIERVPWNLLQRSEEFDNAAWIKSNLSITANNITSPNGTLTADKLTEDTATSQHYIRQNFSAVNGVVYTQSYYVKPNGRTQIQLEFSFGGKPVYTLTGNGSATLGGVIENVGNGWYKISWTATATVTATLYAYIKLYNGSSTYAGDGTSGIYAWGAQLVEGPTAKPYIATTNRQDVPRLDYSNGCPCLLLEPQRTNLVKYSEQFDNAAWEKGSIITVVSNTVIGPDGTQTADTITANGSGYAFVRQNVYGATTGATSSSVFAKKANNRYIGIRNVGAGGLHDVFDFDTKTWTNNSGSNLSFEELKNGWFKLSVSRSSSPIANYYYSIIPAEDTSGIEVISVTNISVYVWGAQAEAASYPTSYIPTTSAAVTRLADAAYKTGISSLIGQTEGVVFVEFIYNGLGTEQRFGISDGTSANYNNARITTGGTLYVLGAASSVLQYEIYCAPLTVGTRYKFALAYKLNDIQVYLNGSSVGSDNSAIIGACSRFGYDNRSSTSVPFFSKVNRTLLFKTRLTNDQLAELTTL